MKILRSVHNNFLVNSYLLVADTGHACIIDPGYASADEWEQIKMLFREKNIQPSMVCITHAHADHIAGLAMLHQDFPRLPVYLHSEGMDVYQSYNRYARIMGLPAMDVMPPIVNITARDNTLSWEGGEIQIKHTPGHLQGSVSFYIPEEKVVFTGDLLFRMSVGRTDMPGGNFQLLEESILTQIYTLPDDTVILPGHGDSTDVAFEKQNNPFVKQIMNQ